MINNYLLKTLHHEKASFYQDKLLYISALFAPLIAPLFFFCPTIVLRNIFYISIPFMVALILKNKSELKELLLENKSICRIVLIFLAYMTFSVLWSETNEEGRIFEKGKLFLFLGISTLSTFLIAYKKPDFIKNIKKTYIFGAISSSIILIINYIYMNGFAVTPIRLEGMGRAENPVQASLVYSLAVIAILLGSSSEKYSRNKEYIIKIAMTLPPLIVILLTQSRGPFLGLILTLLCLYLTNAKQKIKKLIYIIIGLALLSIPTYITLKDTPVLERHTTGRFEIWHSAMQQISERPIFGNGLASNPHYTYTKPNGVVSPASHIHSLYLSTLYQGGIVGLLLLLSIYFLILKEHWVRRQYNSSETKWILGWILMGAAFGIADFGGIMINLSTEWLVFWWPISLTLGYYTRSRMKL